MTHHNNSQNSWVGFVLILIGSSYLSLNNTQSHFVEPLSAINNINFNFKLLFYFTQSFYVIARWYVLQQKNWQYMCAFMIIGAFVKCEFFRRWGLPYGDGS